MILTCLGSGSSGNCYLLTASNGDTLIIEAGVNFTEVKKALNFNLRKIVGCVVSHEHGDHSKYLPDVLSCGIKVLGLKEAFRNVKQKVFCVEVEPLHGYKIGGFKVFTIPVCHDVPCLGFVIEHQEMGKLLFITDTMMLEYKIPHLNHIMIEANYSDEILQENIDNGLVFPFMRDRLMHSHMEIKTTANVLKANDISEVNEIILLHLSGRNSDAGLFKDTIAKAVGKPVYIANRTLKINLDKEPF